MTNLYAQPSLNRPPLPQRPPPTGPRWVRWLRNSSIGLLVIGYGMIAVELAITGFWFVLITLAVFTDSSGFDYFIDRLERTEWLLPAGKSIMCVGLGLGIVWLIVRRVFKVSEHQAPRDHFSGV